MHVTHTFYFICTFTCTCIYAHATVPMEEVSRGSLNWERLLTHDTNDPAPTPSRHPLRSLSLVIYLAFIIA